jgi:hypothetical protein
VKDTSDKLKQASEIDHHADVNVSFEVFVSIYLLLFQLHVQINQSLMVFYIQSV